MIIADSILKATVAEVFSNYIDEKIEETYDYSESWESFQRVCRTLKSDDFKEVAPKAKEKLEELVNETTYEYQKQGFIQGYIKAIEAVKNSKGYEYEELETIQPGEDNKDISVIAEA